MAAKLQIQYRTVRGLSEDRSFDDYSDPLGLLRFDDCKIKAYRENPYLTDPDAPCQLFGVKDNQIVGRRNSYPARFVANGVVHNCRISGSVFVDVNCRSSLLGITLLNKALKLPDGELNINCGLSPVNREFYRLAGANMFRMVCFNVGGSWNKFYKGNHFRGWKKVAAWCISASISTLNWLSSVFCSRRKFGQLPNWEVREIDPNDKPFLAKAAELIAQDGHKFREEITPEWIKWTLTNDFHVESCSKKQMFGVYDDNRFVGFALTRSSRDWGRKKIYEWQLDSAYTTREAEFLSLIAKRINTTGSSTTIMVDDCQAETVQKLTKRFSIAGDDYAVVTIRNDSQYKAIEGIREQKNWRVRPGMGDACLW